MPAVSVAQRRLFAIAEHHPEKLRTKVSGLSKQQLHDFASTSEKRLPQRVKAKRTSNSTLRRFHA